MGKWREMVEARAPSARPLPVVGMRKLYLVDLVSDAVNGPLGLGVFVLLGYVARAVAGPSVIVSTTFAAIIAIIAGYCYAELGAINPKTGSSATLSLNMGGVGEFVAFLASWNLIADLSIGIACSARGFRATLDNLTDNALSDYFEVNTPLYSEYTAAYVDIVALCLPIVLGVCCCFIREYLLTKVAHTIFCLVVFLYVIIAGSFHANGANWSVPSNLVDDGYFLPFGIQGTFQGACVLAIVFIEFRKGAYPARYTESNSPLAVTLAFVCSYFSLFFVGLILTLMVPYNELMEGQELVAAFGLITYKEGKWLVAISALLILAHMMANLTHSIAHELNSLVDEHLLLKYIGNVDVFGQKRPFFGLIIMSIATGLLGGFFEVDQMAPVISVGTLISFGLIMCSAIIQRCRYEQHNMETCSYSQVLKQFVVCEKLEKPTYATATCVKIAIALFCLLSLALSGIIVHCEKQLGSGDPGAIIALIVLSVLALYTFTIIILQPQIKSAVNFKVPLFPFFNGVGVLFTAFLLMSMTRTPEIGWKLLLRLAIWSAVGFLLYIVNLCIRPPLNRKSWLTTSNSDVFSLVPSKGSIPSDGKSSVAVIREKEWKPPDSRRNGWIETQEKENDVPISEIDTISLGTNSVPVDEQTSIVEVSIPSIVVSEIMNNANARAPSEYQESPEFLARKLDEMFTFEAHSSSDEEEVVQVHQASDEENKKETEEVSRTPSPRSPSVRFADDAHSSDDEGKKEKGQEKDEQDELVVPASPAPPPLPPASLLISPHLSAKGRMSVVESFDDTPEVVMRHDPEEKDKKENVSHLNDFQIELRNTLKLRSQKMIDEIENTTLNVNEGIEIFGGKRNRTESEQEEPPAVVSQPTMKAGKFENHAFVEKLDSILKNQIEGKEKRPRAKVYKQKNVVLEELGASNPAGSSKAHVRFSTADLMSAKMKLKSSSVDGAAPAEINNNASSAPAVTKRRAPQPRAKSLDFLSSNVTIVGDI